MDQPTRTARNTTTGLRALYKFVCDLEKKTYTVHRADRVPPPTEYLMRAGKYYWHSTQWVQAKAFCPTGQRTGPILNLNSFGTVSEKFWSISNSRLNVTLPHKRWWTIFWKLKAPFVITRTIKSTYLWGLFSITHMKDLFLFWITRCVSYRRPVLYFKRTIFSAETASKSYIFPILFQLPVYPHFLLILSFNLGLLRHAEPLLWQELKSHS